MFWKRWGTVLDRLPARAGLPVGMGLGAVAGALLLLAPAAVWVPACLILFMAASVLAWSGEPVEVLPAQPAQREPVQVPEAPPGKDLLPTVEMVTIPAGRFLMGSSPQ
jgi:hypothetical protein